MKVLLLSAALLIVPAVTAVAQAPAATATQVLPRHRHHSTPHRAAVRMGKQLGLSTDQQARLEPVLAERRHKTDAIRANAQLSERDRHQQLQAVRRETRVEMSGVLTPSQMQQLKTMRHARHAAPAAPTGA